MLLASHYNANGIDYLEQGIDNMGRSLEFLFTIIGDAVTSLYTMLEDIYYWIVEGEN